MNSPAALATPRWALWVVLLAAAGSYALSTGVRQSMGLFVSPLNTATGLGIGSISLAFAFSQLWWGLTQPIAGAIADRIGWRVLFFGVLLVALGTFITPYMTSTLGLILAVGVLAAGGAGMAGPAVLMPAATRLIVPEKRGVAFGVVDTGSSFGQFLIAPIAGMLMLSFGWASAMQVLALIVLLSLPAAFILRGAPVQQAAAAQPKLSASQAVKVALRNPSYLLLATGFFVCGFHVAFLATHLPGVIAACGLPLQFGAWSLALLGLFNIAGSLGIGWAMGRWRSRSLLSLLYATRAVAVLLFLLAPKTGPVVLIFAAVMGLTFLSTVPPTAGLVAKFFGPANMGTQFGIVMLSHQVGAFAGVWLGGKAFEATGSYDWFWYVDIMLAVAAALINLPIREARVVRRGMSGAAAASAAAPQPGPQMNPRTRALLEGPILPTLLRLGAPNVLVMLAQAGTGLVETYFVGQLGTDALAGMALVFPLVMLMQMTSAGAMGGGIASAIARALGARRSDDADALVLHAIVVALGFGLLFSLALVGGGRWIYTRMGGSGGALDAALAYSNWVFAGAVLVWLFNSLSAVIRGTGNMAFPALVTCAGVPLLVPLSALLIFGWGPVPALGIVGGAVALLLYYLLGSVALALYLWSPRSLLRPALRGLRLRWVLFSDILRVGLFASVSTVSTNLSIAVVVALVGVFGSAAIAGYGTASRLEYLLIPLVFGFGAPLVAMVGTCIGAGQRERALRAAWIGAALSFAMAQAIGLWAAAFPHTWLRLFSDDPAMLEAGTLYLRSVGPLYGFFGLGLVLYFASQGAGKLLWPVLANLLRLAVAALGGWAVLHWGGTLTQVFLVQGLAMVLYGLMNAFAIAGGVWFGPLRWPRRRLAAYSLPD